jgi:hypothetical protein
MSRSGLIAIACAVLCAGAAIEAGTLMPDVDVSPDEARDIAAYLYGQR